MKRRTLNLEKPIPGFEGRYVVSTLGYIRKVGKKDRNYGTLNNRKNLVVHITDNEGKSKMFSMSRLVASVFIPNPEGKPQVDHIDTDRFNNRITNLRWVTPKENNDNMITKLNRRQYSVFRRDSIRRALRAEWPDGTVRYFHTIAAAAIAIGCSPKTLSRCYHGDQPLVFGSIIIRPWETAQTGKIF